MNDIFHCPKPTKSGLPRMIIAGHGRHGKDTVCEIMERLYGVAFVSSSRMCADKAVAPLLTDPKAAAEFLKWVRDTTDTTTLDEMKGSIEQYTSRARWECKEGQTLAQYAFDHRARYRSLWYQAIRYYNWHDATRLYREIEKVADCYCGIRDARELTAVQNSGLVEATVWVDASRRHPLESEKSMTIKPYMATHYIDNNGTLEQLETAVKQFVWGLCGRFPDKT